MLSNDGQPAAWASASALEPVLDAALDPVVIMRADGVVAEWNSAAVAAFGWSRDEAVGRAMADLIVPLQHRTAHIEGLQRYNATGSGPVLGRRLEITALHRAGHEFPVELSISPITIEGKKHFIGFLRDITERRWSEQRLRESEAQFRLIADSSPALMWMADESGGLIFSNKRHDDFFGFAAEELHGVGWQRVVHPDDLDAFRSELARVLTAKEPFKAEARFIAASGETRWLHCEGEPRFQGDGAFAGYIGVSIDITEEKIALEGLAETQRRLDAVLNNASVSIFLMDDRQQCVYMNAAAEQLTGFRLDETQGRPLHDVVHHTRPDGSHFPVDECPIDRAFPENNNQQGEEVFVHKDGHFYPVAFTASPVRDEASKTVGTIIEVQDISERKRAQEHQRLLIDELNHRVKNTLAIVQSIAQQTFKGDAASPETREAFEGRLAALASAHNLLNQKKWESVSMTAIVEDAVKPFRSVAGGFSIDGPDFHMAPQTAVTFALAINELATNAAKHGALTLPQGCVAISWTIQVSGDDQCLQLLWIESDGPRVKPPSLRGFGTRMLQRALANELGGEVNLDFRPEGLVCKVEAPLSGLVA